MCMTKEYILSYLLNTKKNIYIYIIRIIYINKKKKKKDLCFVKNEMYYHRIWCRAWQDKFTWLIPNPINGVIQLWFMWPMPLTFYEFKCGKQASKLYEFLGIDLFIMLDIFHELLQLQGYIYPYHNILVSFPTIWLLWHLVSYTFVSGPLWIIFISYLPRNLNIKKTFF